MIVITKINIVRAILIILLLSLFGTIFNFSNQDGEKSGSLSREITVTITKDIKSIQKLEKSKKEQVLDLIEHIIRKIAHFSLYTLVGLLIMLLMITYNIKQTKRIGVSLIVGALYAISDEIHQSFVPDRTPMIGDVFIDSSGVIFGILLAVLGVKIFIWLKCKLENQN